MENSDEIISSNEGLNDSSNMEMSNLEGFDGEMIKEAKDRKQRRERNDCELNDSMSESEEELSEGDMRDKTSGNNKIGSVRMGNNASTFAILGLGGRSSPMNGMNEGGNEVVTIADVHRDSSMSGSTESVNDRYEKMSDRRMDDQRSESSATVYMDSEQENVGGKKS